MSDEQEPEGSAAPPPTRGEASKAASEAPKTGPPKPTAAAHARPQPPAVMVTTPCESDVMQALKE